MEIDPRGPRTAALITTAVLAAVLMPPPENRLPVAIEAGEKIPVERR